MTNTLEAVRAADVCTKTNSEQSVTESQQRAQSYEKRDAPALRGVPAVIREPQFA